MGFLIVFYLIDLKKMFLVKKKMIIDRNLFRIDKNNFQKNEDSYNLIYLKLVPQKFK